MRYVRGALIAVFVVVVAFASAAQELSEKKDLAVFSLSYYDASIPDKYLGSIDNAIQQVFINIGRFNVLGMTYRLDQGDVSEFVGKIKELKEQNMEIPEKVQMGKEFFTEADLNRIIGSFLVVIPSVASFTIEGGPETTTTSTTEKAEAKVDTSKSKTTASVSKTTTTTTTETEEGDYHATIQTGFTFINIEEMRAIAQATVETHGYDDDRDVAVKEAIDRIPDRLTYEIRKIEEFKLKTGILEVDGRTVIIEFGRDMGIKLGDEFEIIGSRILASGKAMTKSTGLVVIKEVSDEVSIAQVIYANPPAEMGDQLKEFPLFGTDVTPYVQASLGMFMGSRLVFLPGVRTTLTRGFYKFKPLAGLEVPLGLGDPVVSFGLPLNLYVGGEMDLYLGRLQLNPMVAVGVGGSVPTSGEDFYLSHLGFKAGANLTYLIANKFKISVDAGFNYWHALDDLLADDYYGPFVGAGLTIKL